jgi:protein farnesyltransferase subunit beta
LSGLSTAQHHVCYDTSAAEKISKAGLDTSKGGISSLMWVAATDCAVLGDCDNLLAPTHPVHNITVSKVRAMIHHFYAKELEPVLAILPREPDIPVEDVTSPST